MFYGHDLGRVGISPSKEKMNAIRNADAPRNKSEVRSLLGLVTYCSRFIPKFSEITLPLRNLTHVNARFVWTIAEQNPFDRLKEFVCRKETLAHARLPHEDNCRC